MESGSRQVRKSFTTARALFQSRETGGSEQALSKHRSKKIDRKKLDRKKFEKMFGGGSEPSRGGPRTVKKQVTISSRFLAAVGRRSQDSAVEREVSVARPRFQQAPPVSPSSSGAEVEHMSFRDSPFVRRDSEVSVSASPEKRSSQIVLPSAPAGYRGVRMSVSRNRAIFAKVPRADMRDFYIALDILDPQRKRKERQVIENFIAILVVIPKVGGEYNYPAALEAYRSQLTAPSEEGMVTGFIAIMEKQSKAKFELEASRQTALLIQEMLQADQASIAAAAVSLEEDARIASKLARDDVSIQAAASLAASELLVSALAREEASRQEAATMEYMRQEGFIPAPSEAAEHKDRR
ncbi:hypothetical protein ACFL0U_02910 [Pseudomonadota bacterium]